MFDEGTRVYKALTPEDFADDAPDRVTAKLAPAPEGRQLLWSTGDVPQDIEQFRPPRGRVTKRG